MGDLKLLATTVYIYIVSVGVGCFAMYDKITNYELLLMCNYDGRPKTFGHYCIYIILIARVRVQYGKIFYEHAKYFHEPKASENVA